MPRSHWLRGTVLPGVNVAMADYLVRLRTPPRGTVCAADHVPFDPAFGGA